MADEVAALAPAAVVAAAAGVDEEAVAAAVADDSSSRAESRPAVRSSCSPLPRTIWRRRRR